MVDVSGAAPAAAPSCSGENGGRRVGRPTGPERVARTVRLLAEHDRRLAAEVELQGLSQQYLIERALAEYFERLDRRRGRERGGSGRR